MILKKKQNCVWFTFVDEIMFMALFKSALPQGLSRQIALKGHSMMLKKTKENVFFWFTFFDEIMFMALFKSSLQG